MLLHRCNSVLPALHLHISSAYICAVSNACTACICTASDICTAVLPVHCRYKVESASGRQDEREASLEESDQLWSELRHKFIAEVLGSHCLQGSLTPLMLMLSHSGGCAPAAVIPACRIVCSWMDVGAFWVWSLWLSSCLWSWGQSMVCA